MLKVECVTDQVRWSHGSGGACGVSVEAGDVVEDWAYLEGGRMLIVVRGFILVVILEKVCDGWNMDLTQVWDVW